MFYIKILHCVILIGINTFRHFEIMSFVSQWNESIITAWNLFVLKPWKHMKYKLLSVCTFTDISTSKWLLIVKKLSMFAHSLVKFCFFVIPRENCPTPVTFTPIGFRAQNSPLELDINFCCILHFSCVKILGSYYEIWVFNTLCFGKKYWVEFIVLIKIILVIYM